VLARQLQWMDAETHVRTLFQDLTYGLRQLRKSPGFTTVGILTLALGIGANTAIFTLVHAIMLQPLPVKDAGSLYRVGSPDVDCCVTGGLQGIWDAYSYPLYQRVLEGTPEFQTLAAFQAGGTRLSVRRSGENGPARPLRSEYVSGNYFPLFGIQAAAGRLIVPSDDQPNAAPVAVMSHRTWQNYFASDPSIVGATFKLNGVPFTVIGIGPTGFYGDRLSDSPADFWLPIATEPLVAGPSTMLKSPDLHWLYLMGRLQPGASPQAVQQKVSIELQQWLNSGEGATTVADNDRSQIPKQKTMMLPAAAGVNNLAHDSEKLLQVLTAAAGLVLLIACANVANLLLARGAARKVQTSVRLALGAGRWRLVRQLLTESVLLSLLGGLAGVVLAFLGTRGILALAFRGSDVIPIDPHPSTPILLFSLALSLLTGIVFGVAPAWISSHADPAEALRGAVRTTSHGATFYQKMLVVAQAALSLVLVSGAILLVQSLQKLEHQNFGFQTDHRYVVHVGHAFDGYSLEKLGAAYTQLQQKLNAIPGVITASYSLYSPMGGDNWSGPIYIPGRAHDAAAHGDYGSWLRVGPNYFQTVGTSLLRGRTINEQDTPNSARVAVVNERFAKKFFPNQDPIGKRFGGQPEHAGVYEIVGVVEDAKYQDTHGPAYPTYFLPFLQMLAFDNPADNAGQIRSQLMRTIELHVAGTPENLESTVRRTLSEIDPDMAVVRVTRLDEELENNFNQERLMARLTSLFGVLALTLAAIGLYGVTAYTVERRTREIGVRVAVGANRANVVAMVLRGAFTQVAIGLVLGIALALAAGRLISSQLFEIKGYDPLALAGAALLLALFALVAGLVPARRAASIDPVSALRVE
jgi:predicted permease